MSAPQANCPSCGAPVTFRWSSAVQTVCPFCHSILIRDDLTLRNVGKVADLPPDPSPIQLQTSGRYNNKNFDVIGRIIYEYEQGGWNEWHIVFSDGTSGWLSDAQLQYAVSFLVTGIPLPGEAEISRGKRLRFSNIDFEVSTMTIAKYKGVEGELPFPFYGKSSMLFADLRTASNDFATLDYSDESAPMLFLGKTVPYEALALKNVRLFEGWA
jgi:predicted RNA-binding Zn-ribbon protein involved in translation (DUF1610 family)